MNRPSSSRSATAVVALIAAAVLFLAVNVIAGGWLRTSRVDLTQQRLYTLSQGSINTLAKIDEPIVLRYYYSPKLGDEIPSYGVYAQRVREMLEEYAAVAKGKIQLQVLDPQPFSAVEDRAVAFGMQGVPLDQGGEQVYFGLAATNSTDDQQTIPFFQPERERFLEYDLTKLIHNLAFPKKTVVGLVTALPLEGDIMAAMQGRPMVPYVIVDQLRQLYDVKSLSTDFDKVPDDVDVLMVVHPQNIPDKTLYAIDQFVLKGGRAMVFVDPDSETQMMHPSQLNPPGAPNASSFDKLFASWGLQMVPNMVAGDRQAARKVNAGTEARVQAVDYVAWLGLKQKNFNHDDLITAALSQLTMATAGVLEPKEGAKTSFTPLISTSADSEMIPAEKVKGMPDVAGLLRDFKSDNKPLVLAAHITGPVDTAFPDGPPVDKAKEEKAKADAAKAEADKAKDGNADAVKPADAAKPADATADAKPVPAGPPQIKTSAQPINVVVVADTDILEDRFWVQAQDFFGQRVVVPVANNGDFVTNAVDVLSGGNDLISLRTRGTSARPFERIDNIQRVADEHYQQTEKDLQAKLKDTQDKIKELRSQQGKAAGVAPAASETQALDNFRGEMIKIRQQLRQVQLALRQDIKRLQARLEFFDIAFVPILVGIVAIIIGIVRRTRRSRRHRAA